MGVVLAGGASSRMGADKAFIEIEGEPMVVRAVGALRAAGAEPALVVGGDAARLGALGLDAVADRYPGQGPLGGVLTALGAPGSLGVSGIGAVVTLPCDVLAPDAAARLAPAPKSSSWSRSSSPSTSRIPSWPATSSSPPAPSSPVRAYGLLLSAIRDPDPVVFLEPKRAYRAFRQEVEDNGEGLPLDKAFVTRPGTDVTLISWGASALETWNAAGELAGEGIDCEVMDLATVSPLDQETILESVARTGRAVIVHEAAVSGGLGGEVAAILASEGLYSLEAPVVRVAGYDTVPPLARMEYGYIPGVERIKDAVRACVES